MNVETWIRNQILNKNLMLTFFFSFVNDYLLLNFCYRAQWFLGGHLWLGGNQGRLTFRKSKSSFLHFPFTPGRFAVVP